MQTNVYGQSVEVRSRAAGIYLSGKSVSRSGRRSVCHSSEERPSTNPNCGRPCRRTFGEDWAAGSRFSLRSRRVHASLTCPEDPTSATQSKAARSVVDCRRERFQGLRVTRRHAHKVWACSAAQPKRRQRTERTDTSAFARALTFVNVS